MPQDYRALISFMFYQYKYIIPYPSGEYYNSPKDTEFLYAIIYDFSNVYPFIKGSIPY